MPTSALLQQNQRPAPRRVAQAAPPPPPLPLLALEPMRAAIELVAGQLVGTPRRIGDGHPVIVYPGLAANAWSTLALRHADFLGATKLRVDDLAYSAFTRRSHYPHLLAVVGGSAKEVADRLRKFADGQVDPTTLATRFTRKKKPKLYSIIFR